MPGNSSSVPVFSLVLFVLKYNFSLSIDFRCSRIEQPEFVQEI